MDMLTGVSIGILFVSIILAIVEFFRVRSKDQEIKVLSESIVLKDQALKEAKESSERLSKRLKESMIKNIIVGRNLNELDFILSEAKKRLPLKLWKRHFIGIESLNEKFESDLKNPEEALKKPEFKVPAPKIRLEDWIKENYQVPEKDDPIARFEFISSHDIAEQLKEEFKNVNINNSVVQEIGREMMRAGFKRTKSADFGINYWNVIPLKIDQPIEK